MHSDKQRIALLHAQREDMSLLSSLLSDESFEVVPHEDVHSIADQRFDAEVNPYPLPDTFGVVVCARDTVSRSSPATDADSLYRVTDEIGQLTGRFKRVLVLADSMDESTVCSYLGAGAHHVIGLNESPRLMQARLLAGLRQHSEPIQQEWHIGPYHFDLSRRIVTMDGRDLRLSPREFEFSQYLFEHRERIVPISEILSAVWSLPEDTDSRRIDTAACRLRKKMLLGQNDGWQLRRLRREGYQLVRANEVR